MRAWKTARLSFSLNNDVKTDRQDRGLGVPEPESPEEIVQVDVPMQTDS